MRCSASYSMVCKTSYGLPYVSVVLCDPDHDIRHLMLAAGTPAERLCCASRWWIRWPA